MPPRRNSANDASDLPSRRGPLASERELIIVAEPQPASRGFGDRATAAMESGALAAVLADAGASYLHVASEGRSWFDTARLSDGTTVTGLAREVSGLPVIANGGMHDPDQARRVLNDEHADFLAVGHGALANPDLPRRLASGLDLASFDPAMLRPDVTLSTTYRWRQAV